MKYKNCGENQRHPSVSFDDHSSSRNREYPQCTTQSNGYLRDSSGLSSTRSEGYKSTYDRISSSEEYIDNGSRKNQCKGYSGKEEYGREYDYEFPFFHGRPSIRGKGRYDNDGNRRYRNDNDERYHDNEYRGSWHNFPRSDEYDEEEYQKNLSRNRHGTRYQSYRHEEYCGSSSSYPRSATSQNSGRCSVSSSWLSSAGLCDGSNSSAVKSRKYSKCGSKERRTCSQSTETDDRCYLEPQYQCGKIRARSGRTRESLKPCQYELREKPYYPCPQEDRRSHYRHCGDQETSSKGNRKKMAECNVIASAYKQPKQTMPPQEAAMRDIREEDSDDDNCYKAKTRMKECPEHVYTCRTMGLPNPYDTGPDLSRAYVLYGQWQDSVDDPHCHNLGPCEEEYGVCPVITRVKKQNRRKCDEELPAHQYAYREGIVGVPPVENQGHQNDREFMNQVDARRRSYCAALERGDLVFAAHCSHKREPCTYKEDSQGTRPEIYASDPSAYHPQEFENPDYLTCIVKQCKFEYEYPHDFGIPKAKVNAEKPASFYLETKRLKGEKSSVGAGNCVCGDDKATGKRKHRCGFPTLHAAKNARNPGEPFPHPRLDPDNEPPAEVIDIRQSLIKPQSRPSVLKTDRGESFAVYSSKQKQQHRRSSDGMLPVSLCADATCVSSGSCRVSGSGSTDGRSCNVSYASCRDLRRKISPQSATICCLPPLISDMYPRYPLPDPQGRELASSIVSSIVDKATGKNVEEACVSKRNRSSTTTSSIPGYKKTSTHFNEASSAWLHPWNHNKYTGWDSSYGCTAPDESCQYQSSEQYPRTSAVDRWPNYYGYLWKDMKTPVPKFQTCGRKFQTDYLTSNYKCSMW